MGNTTENPEQALLSPKQLAARLGLPITWIYFHAEARSLPHYRVGKYLRFDPIEVERWLQAQRRDTRKA